MSLHNFFFYLKFLPVYYSYTAINLNKAIVAQKNNIKAYNF